jgi:hypothetical protein
VPRYYFHLYNDLDAPDPEGLDLPSLDAARLNALRQGRILAGELVKEEGRLVLHHRIDIEDGQRVVLDTVYFRDTVSVED